MPIKQRDSFLLVLTIIVIEFVSGYLQGFYEPLLGKFSSLLNVDASNLSLFNVLPTAVGALFVPFFTRLGDIRGYRKILRAAITAVFAASLVVWIGVATGSWALVLIGRAVFGAVPVWLPLHIALVHAKTVGERATKAVSAIVATVTVGTVFGTATAGPIYEAFGGSLTATVGIVPGLVCLAVALVWFVMPEFISGAHPYIDKRGFLLLAIVMFLAIFGFVEVVEGGWASVIGAVLLVAAVGTGVSWFRYEKTQEHPAIDVRLLLSRTMAPLYVGAICMGAVFFGFLSPIATYLAHSPDQGFGFGFEPLYQSVAQTAILFFTVVAAILVPFILRRLTPRAALAAGFAIGIVGFVQFTLLPDSPAQLIVFIALVGLGIGIINAAIPVLIPERAPQDQRGIATGLYNSSQTLGGALGGGLFLSLLKIGSIEGADAASTITKVGYNWVWSACAVFLLVGLVAVVVFLGKERRPGAGVAAGTQASPATGVGPDAGTAATGPTTATEASAGTQASPATGVGPDADAAAGTRAGALAAAGTGSQADAGAVAANKATPREQLSHEP
ncbi:MAG: MFS transporter [Bifidobacteriaceae bacterium]|jgi:MFS family permease|nr:MFS transporter [Bifidobacteriaceae bacterium]